MTGDQFITDIDKVDEIVKTYFADFNILACDMESCAIAQSCYLTKVPFIIVRAISDLIGSNNKFEYQTFAPKAALNAALLIEDIIKNCEI